jgi:NAD(P)-dependent dehydrogenase (short-subunit alcohol dehydrogenase family)
MGGAAARRHELFSIAGKTALVTGGARGIGRMIAGGFVQAGAKVYVTSRSPEVCEDAAAELSELPGGGACHPLTADLSSEDGCRALAAAVKEREPSLEILVNNAGSMGDMWMRRLSSAVWREVLAVNVEAGFYLVRELLPLLKAASRDGDPARVLNMGSIAGHTTSDLDIYPYSASKAAVHHMTAHMARRLAPDVTVNALAPGFYATRLTETVLKMFGPSVVKAIPLQRIGTPEDLVGSAIFLTSRAGAFLTGAVIPVDGGSATI